jgi:hypothetical protein
MLRLLLVIHDHQPVGNFDDVVEEAVELAYRPYLEEMERFPALPFGLHVSGPLLEWLEKHDAALLDRIAKGVDDGRIEVIGGGFGEPILPMIPHRDRIGQIVALSDWIERRLGTRPRGAWLSERVWEAGLASSLAEAGIEYTFLDDSHFLAAGRAETELRGCFTVEDGGKLVRVFPIAERLRYEIPFATVDHVLRHLREEAARGESPVLCYADDGEKFGIWPETHEHVYENGWLRAFLEALVEAEDDVRVVSPGEAVDTIPPVGRVYLPDASYREMNEWTLPIPARRRYEKAAAELEETRTTAEARGVLRGGVWRNFLVHYPESNLMVSRMLRASDRVADLPEGSEARLDLYRGQCNCAYWHGIFGGLYLPHLRSAVYRHLLRADRLADAGAPPIRVDLVDYDRDGMDEVVLETPDLSAVIAPGRGGHLIDLSSRRKAVNLLNVLARRPEYEQEELDRAPEADPAAGDGTVKTIHHAAVEDVEGLREHLVFDEPSLESLMDRLYDTDGVEVPGFAAARYEVERAEVDDDGAVLDLSHRDSGAGLAVEKGMALAARGDTLAVRYRLTSDLARRVRWTVEVSAGIPGGDSFGRHYRVNGKPAPGNLLTPLGETGVKSLEVVDDGEGIVLELASDTPFALEADPVRTVSRSEGGFDLIFQAARIRMSWDLDLEPGVPRETRLDLTTVVR